MKPIPKKDTSLLVKIDGVAKLRCDAKFWSQIFFSTKQTLQNQIQRKLLEYKYNFIN